MLAVIVLILVLTAVVMAELASCVKISKSDSVQSNSDSGKTDEAKNEVVSVKINSSESKNLEDWLDDFLDD